MINLPPGRSMACTALKTGPLSRMKCKEFAIRTPSRSPRSNGLVKSATRTSIGPWIERTALASLSMAVMWASGPSRSASAEVKAPSPAPRSAQRPPRPPTPSLMSATRSACLNFFPNSRRDVRHEAPHLVGVVGDEERVHPVVDHERDKCWGVELSRVQHAPDRTRVATRRDRSFIDAPVALQEVGLFDVAVRRHPTVTQPADDRKHPGLVGAEPDADRVLRLGTRMRAGKPIELALEADTVLPAPQKADHLDRLLDRRHGLSRRPHRPVVGLDPLPEASRAQAQLQAPVAQDVERRGGLGEHGRRAQRHVRDVGKETDARGPHRDRGQERPGVEEAALIRVVLDADDVEPELVRRDRLSHRVLGRYGGDEYSEPDRLPVVHPEARMAAAPRGIPQREGPQRALSPVERLLGRRRYGGALTPACPP